MVPNFTHYSGCSDPKLEAELESNHLKLQEEAKTKAIHLAKQNRPALTGEHITHYTGDAEAAYKAMVTQIWQQLQPEIAPAESEMTAKESDRKIRELQEKKRGLETELMNEELAMKQNGISLEEINNFRPKPVERSLIPICIAAGEFALNIFSFQLLGDSMLISIVISAGVSAALFLLAKNCAKHLKEGNVRSRKNILITAAASVLALGVFWIIAFLRSEHLKEVSEVNMHPLWLVLLNVLFYVITLWYFYRNSSSPEENNKYENLLRLKEKLSGFKNQITQLEEDEKKMKQETSDTLNLLMHKPGYAKWLSEKVYKWSDETVEVFKSQNLMHRPDRKIPECFSSDKRMK